MSNIKDLIEQGRELTGDVLSEDVVVDDSAYPHPNHTPQIDIPQMDAEGAAYNEGWGWGDPMQPGEQNQNHSWSKGHGPYVRDPTVARAKLQNAQIYLKEAAEFLENAGRFMEQGFAADEMADLSRQVRVIHQRALSLGREMKG